MSKSITVSVFLIAAWVWSPLCVTGATQGTHRSAEALTNADIIKMTKGGLSEPVILAAIQNAVRRGFDLSPDGLVALKGAGVSDTVIAAMLRPPSAPVATPTIPAPPVPPNVAAALQNMLMPRGYEGIAVTLLPTGGHEIPLELARGVSSVSGMGSFFFQYIDYPGMMARIRVKDSRPVIVVRSHIPPRGQFFVVKLDSNPKDGDRSLKIGSAKQRLRFSSKHGLKPDHDWTIPYLEQEESRDVWHLTLERPLAVGEYGVYIHFGLVAEGGGLFDFGVD